MQTVVVRVTSMKVQTKYGSTSMEVEPVGDLLYAIQLPDDVFVDGEVRMLVSKGIQHIFKGLQVALSYQTEEGDF